MQNREDMIQELSCDGLGADFGFIYQRFSSLLGDEASLF